MADGEDRSRADTSWRRWLDGTLTAAALVAVGWFYYWTVDLSHGFEPTDGGDYYGLLVQGYRQGHLYLNIEPHPRMAKLADPYDPAQNGPYRLADASYFRGHYYLYFGVAPVVVLMLPYAVLTGHAMPTGEAVLVFCLIGFLAASGLWLAIRRRYFPGSAVGTGAAGVLMLGLATHVLALARRPMEWELPIAAGFAFAMLALAAIYAAVHGRRPLLALGAAGLCLGLATASRPPNVFGAAMLLAPLWLMGRERRAGRVWWRGGLAAAVGLGLCIAAMLAHNYARFGNALEFGQNYQLTASHELKNRHFGLDYMAHNLGVYYFCPVRWTWEFPFVSAQTPASDIPDYAGTEEMCGLAVTLPFLWLALAAPLAWWRRAEEAGRRLRATLGAIAGLYLGVGTFLLTFFSTTERYVAEFAPALALLAACGWLGLERWVQQGTWRKAVWPVTVLAGAVTAAMGVLVSFDYHGRLASRDAPARWLRLEQASQAALGRAGFWLGQFSGPRVLKVRFTARPVGTVETFWQAKDARANERVVIEHMGAHEVRFGYARGDAPVRWGRLLTWEPDHTHTVEVQVPSLYGATGGWMSGLRQRVAFRERSCAAIWFSGGRAFGEIVEPWPEGIEPGGRVGSDFSGEVRHVGGRLFREDEIGLGGTPAELSDVRGGTLRLGVVLPEKLAPDGEPLFAAGALYGSDMVIVREAGEGGVKFCFEHFGSPVHETKPLRLDRRRGHTVEITLPSCAAGAFSGAANGDVMLRVDGEDVLQLRSDCHPFAAGEESIGLNPFGTSCAREFRGWLLDARWTGAASP